MYKKTLAIGLLLIAMSMVPSLADDSPLVMMRMNNGDTRIIRLDKAQPLQARGEGTLMSTEGETTSTEHPLNDLRPPGTYVRQGVLTHDVPGSVNGPDGER